MTTDHAVMTCANHPGVETGVSCGKCEKPLCPRCMIFTPVGVRCRECARMRPPPQFDLSGGVRARVLAVAAAIVVGGGGVLGLLHLDGLGLILSLLVGFGTGEALSRAGKRKQGGQMEVIAGATVVLTIVVARAVELTLGGHVAAEMVLPLTVASLTNIYSLLGLLLGVVLAVGRVR